MTVELVDQNGRTLRFTCSVANEPQDEYAARWLIEMCRQLELHGIARLVSGAQIVHRAAGRA